MKVFDAGFHLAVRALNLKTMSCEESFVDHSDIVCVHANSQNALRTRDLLVLYIGHCVYRDQKSCMSAKRSARTVLPGEGKAQN
jgi:hypothetical protein